MDKQKIRKDSAGLSAKSPSAKSEKSNSKKSSEKRISDQNIKKYALISPVSVSIMAESIGVSEISEDVCAALSEDVSFKLREIVHKCSILAHNNKRRKVQTDDVNRVLEMSSTSAIYGHSYFEALDFKHIPRADVYTENDNEIDIVAMSTLATQCTKLGEEYVRGSWLLPDSVDKPDSQAAHKDVKEEPSTSKQETPPTPSQAPKASTRAEDVHALTKPPPHFINYYLQMARAIIGSTEPHLRVALQDLRTNSKIGPLVPYFLNLVALSVNKLQRNGRLTDALLRTIEALVDNPHVDPSSQLAVNRAVNSLLVVAIEPKIAKNCDDLLLRKKAAQLLAKVFMCWSIELKQQIDTVRQLLQLLLDGSISLKSQYGAVVTLTALGQRILDMYFWPILDRYISMLEERQTAGMSRRTAHGDAQDVQFIKGAIMIAVERMYRRGKTPLSGEDLKRRQKLEQKLQEFFGDALVLRYNLKTTAGSVYPGTLVVMTSETEPTDAQPLSDIDLKFRESMFQSHSSRSHFSYKPDVRGTMPKLHMYSVFSLSSYAFRQPKEIIFNFIGSNQINSSLLKKRKIGLFLQKEHKSNHYKFAQMWHKQKGLKKTRSIKYCSPLHKKSSVGDLFGFL